MPFLRSVSQQRQNWPNKKIGDKMIALTVFIMLLHYAVAMVGYLVFEAIYPPASIPFAAGYLLTKYALITNDHLSLIHGLIYDRENTVKVFDKERKKGEEK